MKNLKSSSTIISGKIISCLFFRNIIIKIIIMFFSLQSLVIKHTYSLPITNIDNNFRVLNFSNYLQNSQIGSIFYNESVMQNITSQSASQEISFDVSSPVIETGQSAKIGLNPISQYAILKYFYLEKNERNLTYLKDYNITYNIDDSVVPNDIFQDLNYNNIQTNSVSSTANRGNDTNNTSFLSKNMEFGLNCLYENKGISYYWELLDYEFPYKKSENIIGMNIALTRDNKLRRLIFLNYSFVEEVINENTWDININKNKHTNETMNIKSNNESNTVFTSLVNKTFDDFYLVNQLYEYGTFIFAIKDSWLSVYNITDYKLDGNHVVQFFTEFNLLQIFKNKNSINNTTTTNNNTSNNNSINSNTNLALPNITRFGTYKDQIYISTLDSGLVILKKNQVTDLWEPTFINTVQFQNLTKELRIRDMSINANSIYIICENLGLKIFDIKKFAFTDFEFFHPYLLKLDSVFPDNALTPSYSLLVDNSKAEINEFMIEFKKKDNDEFNIQINRVYLTSQKSGPNSFNPLQEKENALMSFTDQLNLGIILDKQNENIIFTTRGVPNFMDIYTYKINLPKIYNSFTPISYPSSVVNSSDSAFNLTNKDYYSSNKLNTDIFFLSASAFKFNTTILLRFPNSKTLMIRDIKYSPVYLTCRYNDDGYFQTNFIFKAYCRNQLSQNFYDSYRSCPVLVSVPLIVQGGMNTAMWIIIALIVVIIFAFILLIICCFKRKGLKFPRDHTGHKQIEYHQQDNTATPRKNLGGYNNSNNDYQNTNLKNHNNDNNNNNNDVIEIQVLDN